MGTLWHNGSIYTMQTEYDRVEAIFTENGLIIEVGEASTLRNTYQDMITNEINLQGQMLIPGLVDSHLHLIGHGEKLMRLDLSKMKSRAEILQALLEKCAQTPAGEWIIAEGWNENEWQDSTLILRDDLDQLSNEHPLILKRVCRHAVVVNSLAMTISGIEENIEQPFGGVIGRYKDDRLNGMFKEDPALKLIMNHLPGITEEYVRRALTVSIRDCHRLGLTGGHSEDLHYYNGFLPTYQAFVSVIEEAGLPFRVNLLVHNKVVDDMKESGYGYRSKRGLIELDAMKIFADGSLGGNTALLSHPYHDRPETQGVAIYTENELHDLVQKARNYEMPIAVHAIGDLAFEMVLNAICTYPPKLGLRDRLIHAQIMRHDLLDRAKELPVIFDIQPGFVPSDFPWVIDKVGKDHMAANYAWKTYMEKGIQCAGGSDAPIEPVDPLLGIHAAVTRRKPFDADQTIYGEKECLSLFEALSLYTTGSAYAIGQEESRGKIAPGYIADFTVFENDLYTVHPDEWLEIEAAMTVVNEQIVYVKK
ncbi:amidohydrolase [Peribacillus loiseleuriae]|uniref:Amidohydrolase n=2 Tax=Peribacillus loiseleuriae TaxID=1679170 RepID=A0A0K9GXA1_9BACI|nr:amidohydrolase [Peribacillus loiseleuriae]KMY51260.1 amidohydrolase [Peribacillus loiseleuriae]